MNPTQNHRRKTKRWGLTIYQQKYGPGKYTRTWYYRVMVDKQSHVFGLGVDPVEAGKLAEEIFVQVQDPRVSITEVLKRYKEPEEAEPVNPGGEATIGQVVEIYLRDFRRLEIGQGTAKGNVAKLYGALRRAECMRQGKPFVKLSGARIDHSGINAMRLSKLSLKTVADMKESFLDDAEDLEEELQAKRNANSYWLGARGLFAEAAWEHYESLGLQLPDRDTWTFLKGKMFKNTKRRKLMTEYSIIEKVMAGLPELKESDPNAYRAFMVATHCSLRRKEMGHVKWRWFRIEGRGKKKRVVLEIPDADGDFRPKGQKGRRVIVEQWVYDEIFKMREDGEEYVVEGDEKERLVAYNRSPLVLQRLGGWLRGKGVTEAKPYHNLRSWWFCAKVKKDGILAAQQQGGHEDPKTTSDSYADNEMPEDLMAFWVKAG